MYKQALAIDPQNVYANVMYAHWLMWQGGTLEAARPYFDAALATGKERPLVRTLQLAAIRNRNGSDADAEFIRVVDSMRRQNETLGARAARDAYTVYVRRYGAGRRAADEAAVGLPTAELLATYLWLTRMPGMSKDSPDGDDAVVATLNQLVQQDRRSAGASPAR
jgi:hypothetical protein